MIYNDFLAHKRERAAPTGLADQPKKALPNGGDDISKLLYPFQEHLLNWAIEGVRPLPAPSERGEV